MSWMQFNQPVQPVAHTCFELLIDPHHLQMLLSLTLTAVSCMQEALER